MDFAYTPEVEALRSARQGIHGPSRGAADRRLAARGRGRDLATGHDRAAQGPGPAGGGLGSWSPVALADDEPGTRLANLEYAPLAEIMGRVFWASEVFNCSAPDTGNMELLHMFASPEQRVGLAAAPDRAARSAPASP